MTCPFCCFICKAELATFQIVHIDAVQCWVVMLNILQMAAIS